MLRSMVRGSSIAARAMETGQVTSSRSMTTQGNEARLEGCKRSYFTLYSRCMRTFRRLLEFLRPYRRPLIGSLLLAWLAMGMTVLIPLLIGGAVNAIEP